jgi:predicted amidophosphoribosyltransferase
MGLLARVRFNDMGMVMTQISELEALKMPGTPEDKYNHIQILSYNEALEHAISIAKRHEERWGSEEMHRVVWKAIAPFMATHDGTFANIEEAAKAALLAIRAKMGEV